MEENKPKKVKITVLKVSFNEELAKEYAVEGYPPCLIHKEGQVMYSNGWQKPKEMCDYAWAAMRDFVLSIAQGGGHILGKGNWLKEKDMAIVTCNDGIKPVTFKVERTNENAEVFMA